MNRTVIAVVILAACGGGAVAQENGDAPRMTCGEFLALEDQGQMAAMLELRRAYAGEDAPKAEEARDATKVTGATEAGAASGMQEEDPVEAEQRARSAETRERLAGVRTSCLDMPDIPAIDALVAAHAHYDPERRDAAAPE